MCVISGAFHNSLRSIVSLLNGCLSSKCPFAIVSTASSEQGSETHGRCITPCWWYIWYCINALIAIILKQASFICCQGTKYQRITLVFLAASYLPWCLGDYIKCRWINSDGIEDETRLRMTNHNKCGQNQSNFKSFPIFSIIKVLT